jgi:hypothetical protein
MSDSVKHMRPVKRKRTYPVPDWDQFRLGWSAFFYGDFNNPNTPGTFRHKEWARGWDAGYFYNKWKQYRFGRYDMRLTLIDVQPAGAA